MERKPKNKVKNKEFLDNQWKEGETGNPNGRPLGQKNYVTLRREAIIAIGKQNGKTPEEIEIMLHSKGIAEALKGNYQFYRDDLDRTHGQATQKTELSVGKLEIVFDPLFDVKTSSKTTGDSKE